MKAILQNKFYILFLAAFSFLLYYQTLNYSFIHWDDDKQITENPRIKKINAENLSHNFMYERYTALSLYSYMIDYQLHGQNAAAFRLVSMVLHALNVILVFLLLLFLTGSRLTAFFAALLFACHPLRVESVVWISERKDVLFAFWGLLALLSYRKYIVSENKSYYLAAFLLSLLSSFSKIQGILIPLSFFLIDFWYRRKITLRMAGEKLIILFTIFFIMKRLAIVFAVAYLIWFFVPEPIKKKLLPPVNLKKGKVILAAVGVLILGFFIYLYLANPFGLWDAYTPSKSAQFGIFDRFFLATYALSHYLLRFVFPYPMSAVYPYPELENGALPFFFYFSAIILIPLLYFAYTAVIRKKTAPVYVFGIAFFLLNISIVLHILPIEGRLLVADRYSYLAYTGLFLIASHALMTYVKSKKIIWTFIVLSVALFSYRNFSRQPVWENTGALFTDVLKHDSSIAFAVNNLAVYELYNNRHENALELIDRSIALDSTDPMNWYNKGLILFNLKRPAEAVNAYQQMLQYAYHSDDTALAYNDMGQCYISMGDPETGIMKLKESIRISDKIPSAYNNLGWYYYMINQPDSAKTMFQKSLDLNPDYPEALNNMGSLLFSSGMTDSALSYFDRAIEIKPTYALAHNNRGYYFLMRNDLNSALQSFNQSIEANSNFLEAYLNRAWISYNRKEYKKAIADYDFILSRDSSNSTAFSNRAFSYLMQGDAKKAIPDFSAVIRLKPDVPDHYLNRGKAYLQNRDYMKAIDDFNSALKLAEKPLYYQARAVANYEIKNYSAAEKDLMQCIRMEPENAEHYYYMGRVMAATGRQKEACGVYRKSAGMGNTAAQKELQNCL